MGHEGTGLTQSGFSFAGLPSSTQDRLSSRYVVLPVPYEATTEWLSGTRHAPFSIIDSSRLLELYDCAIDTDVSEAGIYTAEEMAPDMSGPQSMTDKVEAEVGRWLDEGKVPVLVGGEHTISLGAVRALAARYPDLSVLQLDAHSDLRNDYLGARVSQATVMRRVREICPAVQIGIRSLSSAENHHIKENNLPVVFWPPKKPSSEWLPAALSHLTDSVYITIDADVFDSSILPWVGTPEPGGLTWDDVWQVLEPVARTRTIVGFDVVEFCPREAGAAPSAYMLAKLIYRLIGYSWLHTLGESNNDTRAQRTEQEASSAWLNHRTLQ